MGTPKANLLIPDLAGRSSTPITLATPSLTATAGSPTKVNLTWSAVSQALGYRVYQMNGSQATLLTTLGANATTYQDLKDSDLGALMQLSADPNASDNALNVFFVRTISGGTLEGYIILGESAGIPGVPVRGTTGSGMAVTTADFPQGLNDIADTWVHEGSHWLGLFHTTESSGTPPCDRTVAATSSGVPWPYRAYRSGHSTLYP